MAEERALERSGATNFQNALYGVLADRHRRRTLRYLAEQRAPVSLERLATELAAVDHGIAVEEVTSERRDEVLVGLVHVHLPKMQDVGLIGWDPDGGQVGLSPLTEQLTLTTTGSPLDASVSVKSEAEQ